MLEARTRHSKVIGTSGKITILVTVKWVNDISSQIGHRSNGAASKMQALVTCSRLDVLELLLSMTEIEGQQQFCRGDNLRCAAESSTSLPRIVSAAAKVTLAFGDTAKITFKD
jgi:hypothetical protein